MSWADQGRRCDVCDVVTYRPPRSAEPCRRCGGELRDETPEEATARRRLHHGAARERGQA